MRLGELCERRSHLAQSLDVYRSVLDWDSKSIEALRAIVRLTEHVGDSYELAYSIEGLLRVEAGEPGAALALRLLALRREQEDREGIDRAIQLGFRAHPASQELRAELLARGREQGPMGELAAVLEEGFASNPNDRELLGALLESCRQAGSFEPALAAVTRALETAPQEVELYRERARVLEALGRYEEAARDLERVYAEGGAQFSSDLMDGLARLVERIGAPADRATKLRLADLLLGAGQLDASRSHLSELLRRDGKDRDALRALARVEEQEEHWDAVSTIFRKLLPLEEGQALVDVARKLALACERAGRPADARSGLERALKAAPGDAELRRKLEDIYEKSGANRELAELVFEDAKRQGDVAGRFALLLRAGHLLASSEGDPERAVAVLEEARGLRPEDEDAIVLLGRAYGAAGRSGDAVRILQEAFGARAGARTPKVAAMYRELAKVRQRDGDLPAALDLLTHAFEIDLHNGGIALELGLLAREVGNEELAARALRSVTFMKTAGPGSTDGALPAAKGSAYCCLAQMARERGDVRKARLLAQKALTEDPSLDVARQLLAELRAG